MTEWIRPGPGAIEAGLQPDGLVIHVYSVPDAELLRVSRIDLRNVEDAATADAEAVDGRTVCLVCYDGDTGERLPWPWSTIEEALADTMEGWSE